MMRVILNGNGTTRLYDLVEHFIKPELLEDETIDAELKDVEGVYKRDGLTMYTERRGVRVPEDLSNGTKALILFTCFNQHHKLISSACCGANVAKYIPDISRKYDFDIALDYFLNLPNDSVVDAIDSETGRTFRTGREFKDFYSGREGVPEE